MENTLDNDLVLEEGTFINEGFGNRCCIDGSFFDEGGICSHGHQRGEVYSKQIPKKDSGTVKKETVQHHAEDKNHIICEALSGVRCNICGGIFDEADDICGLGGHQIGVRYQKM